MKKLLSFLMAIFLLATIFTGCNKKETQETVPQNNDSKTTIRYLNFKPEIANVYDEIAKAYNKETGNTLIVETAASGNYEQTLAAKMGTNEAPTLFQINGPKGYLNWKDYCADLSNTELYKHLTDKSLAITVDGKVYGIPYVVEGYGIIYNEEITDKYFALEDRATEFKSMNEIKNFDSLKKLVEDMQKNADKLGIKGVFAATSLKTGEDWRWQTHLANIPVYYEFKENDIDLSSNATNTIKFNYSENFKNIFDLYINNSTTDKKVLGSKIVDESMAEFALGQCAMVQNGNWAWAQINSNNKNTVKAESIKYLPIYMGVKGEEKQGLCIGTENFFAINSKATEQEQKVAADFIYWLFSSETGKKIVNEQLEFIAPFDTFSDEERPKDPLAQEVIKWMNNAEVTTIPWNFTVFPSQTFKEDFGASLLQYAQGTKNWEQVKEDFTKTWKNESQ
ncbi:MAG: ABC transporter substrate-binding protein [Clostridia bacterium]|nr:ABC transporter substrate-binding protein [Clostridia bacterium]